ncbi:MAG TPA: hypothetical protein PLJ27_06915 [Polyangiaceae bacterium]|jgi:Flp pilus assembly pilin Flp|nr:MAG: hypothetical protein BWY17_03299 [Deltaproteobacteria bacterium ADurb.Bin207]HNS99984.1 hypothetical protein [Polyangiaceae bacterium]HNZ23740.1 hypothetical protein [Polyangiaceae bacterium]HOD23057.1 hypothetical protein [Polyangiaceae bacterium]HOE48965.1 hypothetical protein [Polyangiaceae bacterium]
MSERFGRMVGTKEASRDFSFVWLLVGGYYLNRRVCASGLEDWTDGGRDLGRAAMKILTRLRARVLGRYIPKGEEGAVMSEYVVLVGVVSLSLATSIAALGPVLFASYERARGIIICPIP